MSKSRFNKEQKEMLNAEFPLMVVAGPGSGKTHTLIEKIIVSSF